MLQLENKMKKTKETNIIQPDNSELLEGSVTLAFNPGAHYDSISHLRRSLLEDPDIKITSTGGIAGKGSWVRLVIKKPVPLFQILYRMPDVLAVARKGEEIQVTTY